MSALSFLLNTVGTIVSIAFPPAAPIIGFIEQAEPYAEAAIPLIKDAIEEGPQAFAAAKHAAPEFFGHMQTFATALRGLSGKSGPASAGELVQVAAAIAGVDPPGWAHDETQRWWDRAAGEH